MTTVSGERLMRTGEGTSKATLAVRDLLDGLSAWRLWLMFAWLDVRQRYRRAVIGPFWITISMAVMVVALGTIYAGLFGVDVHSLMPFIAGGFVTWFFVSGVISDSTSAYIGAAGFVEHGGVPLSSHVYRVVARNLIVFGHNVVVMIPIYIWQPDLLNWNLLLVIPGVIITTLNLAWMGIVLAALCTRFRDLPPIVASILQAALFASPILFKPSLIPPHLSFLVDLNPVYYLLEVIRSPLLGEQPALSIYVVQAAALVIGWGLAAMFFTKFRHRIAYWI